MAEQFEIVWTRAATVDLDRIFEYVADNSGFERAFALYEKIRGHITTLTTLPRRGRIVPELRDIAVREFRELLIRPYRIIFRLDGRKVVLVGILDGRRDLESILVDRALRI